MGVMGMVPGLPPENLASKLVCTLSAAEVEVYRNPAYAASGHTEKVLVCLLLIFPGQFAIGDMVEVLEPLKIADCDSPSIGKHVLRQENNSSHHTLISSSYSPESPTHSCCAESSQLAG